MTECFPIEFNRVWRETGFESRIEARNQVIWNFEEGVDYCFRKTTKTKEDGSGLYYVEIRMTAECFSDLQGIANGSTRHFFFPVQEEILSKLQRDLLYLHLVKGKSCKEIAIIHDFKFSPFRVDQICRQSMRKLNTEGIKPLKAAKYLKELVEGDRVYPPNLNNPVTPPLVESML